MTNFTNNHKYVMLALDQRGSFEKIVGSNDMNVLTTKKSQVINALCDKFSGVLLDPKLGLPAYRSSGCNKPFLLCAEKTGYTQEDQERITEIEYSVEQIKQLGASGVKLLVYFNPFLDSASKQLETARGVLTDCQKFGLPLFFEIVTYGDDQGKNLIVESVDYFLKNDFRPDVFKLEYPGDEASCQKVSQMLDGIDWILLTAGVDYYQFVEELQIAVRNGCNGFLAGRSIWKDAVSKEIGQQEISVMQERFERIRQIAEGT